MPTHRFILYFGLISFLIAFSHSLSVRLSLEYYFWWFDLIPHTLGGMWVVLLSYFFSRYFLRQKFSLSLFAFLAACIVLGIAVFWEVFEVWYKVAVTSREGYWQDTYLDLIFDGIGAVVGYLMVRRSYLHEQHV